MIHKLFKKEIRSLTAFFTELFAKMSKVRIHEKKIGSHKSYNFLKTNEFRLKIPFASCYLDISCLVRLKNRSRMIKRSFWESAGPGHTVRRSHLRRSPIKEKKKVYLVYFKTRIEYVGTMRIFSTVLDLPIPGFYLYHFMLPGDIPSSWHTGGLPRPMGYYSSSRSAWRTPLVLLPPERGANPGSDSLPKPSIPH